MLTKPKRPVSVVAKQCAASPIIMDQVLLPELLSYDLRLAQERVFGDFAQVIRGTDLRVGRLWMLEDRDANAGLSQSPWCAVRG